MVCILLLLVRCCSCMLTSKCIARVISVEVSKTLSPLQFGFGVPVSCEAIFDILKSVHDLGPNALFSWISPMFSICNNQEMMFVEVRAHILSTWMECCYGAQPLLHHGILSCCCVQQGLSIGPLGFALVLHPIIVETIKKEVPGLLIYVCGQWYSLWIRSRLA